MPVELVWQQPNGLIKRHVDHVTGKEIFDANSLAESDARFDSLKYVINDFLGCTGLSVSHDEIEEIAAVDNAAAKSNPNIRIAIVATNPEVLAATDFYANHPLSMFTIRIFSAMDEACRWLGVSGCV